MSKFTASSLQTLSKCHCTKRNAVHLSWRALATATSPAATGTGYVPTFQRPIPPPKDKIQTVQDFLNLINKGRKLGEYSEKFQDWNELFGSDGRILTEKGLTVKDRRYLLRCLERYRQGKPLPKIGVKLKKPKKIRGWGPAIQNGKRVKTWKMGARPARTPIPKPKKQNRIERLLNDANLIDKTKAREVIMKHVQEQRNAKRKL